jgi:hypothetical protein
MPVLSHRLSRAQDFAPVQRKFGDGCALQLAIHMGTVLRRQSRARASFERAGTVVDRDG